MVHTVSGHNFCGVALLIPTSISQHEINIHLNQMYGEVFIRTELLGHTFIEIA